MLAEEEDEESLFSASKRPCWPATTGITARDNRHGPLELFVCMTCRNSYVKNDRNEWVSKWELWQTEPDLVARLQREVEQLLSIDQGSTKQ